MKLNRLLAIRWLVGCVQITFYYCSADVCSAVAGC